MTLKVSLYDTIVIADSCLFLQHAHLCLYLVFGPTLGKQQLAAAPSRVG